MSSPTSKAALRVGLILLLLGAVAFVLSQDFLRFLSVDFLKSRLVELQLFVSERPILSAALYFGVYVLVTALSLPGAAVLTLAGGAVFGLWKGVLLVSFASSIGATLAFLAARLILRDWVQGRFGEKLRKVNEGVEREGAFYLFSLRLVPLFPFFAVNLLMALTPLRTFTFYWVSQLGMLPGTLAYVNAGTQLSQIRSASGVLSADVILAFAILGLLPLLSKKALNHFRKN